MTAHERDVQDRPEGSAEEKRAKAIEFRNVGAKIGTEIRVYYKAYLDDDSDAMLKHEADVVHVEEEVHEFKVIHREQTITPSIEEGSVLSKER
jgi:hypothetical protein